MQNRSIILFFFLLVNILIPCCAQEACRDICDYLIQYNITKLISTSANVSASNYCDSTAWYCLGRTVEVQNTHLVDPNLPIPGWNSEGMVPQFVMLEFPRQRNVHCIRLYIDMEPNGDSVHLLYAGKTSNQLTLVKNITNTEVTPDTINLTFDPPLRKIRYLKLLTTVSPSWVAWNKFVVYGK